MSGMDEFIDKFASDPERVRHALAPVRHRRRLNNGEFLCRRGDLAECVWIIDEGILAIDDGAKIGRRQRGELVGEIAFHRSGENVRSASMVADGTTQVWQIDRSLIDKMSPDDRAAWLETVATVLAEKMVEATEHRSRLINENASIDRVLRRFVCQDGLMVVNGALGGPDQARIVPDSTDALLWFSDVAGFSEFANTLTPEEAARHIRRFMEIQVDEIAGAGGEIDKFMGDGLMAFWRLPDDIRVRDRIPRAVTAALAVVQHINTVVAAENLPLDIRIGLHMGPVVIGDFGGQDRIAYTLMGETVNTASRFEQARLDVEGRPLGRVRVSEAVFGRMVDPTLLPRFDPRPRKFTVKGDRVFIAHTSIEQEA